MSVLRYLYRHNRQTGTLRTYRTRKPPGKPCASVSNPPPQTLQERKILNVLT